MSDKPIPFTGPMVRAILDGRKTQTRRVLKPQPVGEMPKNWTRENDRAVRFAVGDRLWVREAWRARDVWDEDSPRFIPKTEPIQYEATEPLKNGRSLGGRQRPGMFMPRWASRLTVTVTDVRVQRVQEISEADAIAEGVERRPVTDMAGNPQGDWWFGVPYCGEATAVSAFATLWDDINNPQGLCADANPKGWDANPWVAAYTFTAEQRNIDA